MTTFVYLASPRVIIEKIESTLKGDIDIQGTLGLKEDARNGYEQIKVAFKVTSNAEKKKNKRTNQTCTKAITNI